MVGTAYDSSDLQPNQSFDFEGYLNVNCLIQDMSCSREVRK